MELIDKAAVVAEIKRIYNEDYKFLPSDLVESIQDFKDDLLIALDTLEVKEVDIWHLQEKEDIYDAVKDWSLQTFACVMKDGTIQKFNGCLDEDCEGHINAHIDGVNDGYDNVDDIVKWIEII